MKRVFLTGRSGFVGRNILPYLQERHEVLAPSRAELDLYDAGAVRAFVDDNRIDVVLHGANPNPVKNALDRQDRFFYDGLRMFANVARCAVDCERVLYFGSGAEYDKRREIAGVREEEIGASVPVDDYGFAKYLMNGIAAGSDNVTNLRLFACFGPYDHSSKFITHAIDCCLEGRPVTIRQDCWFDYQHVDDVARIADRFIEGAPRHRDYNLCSGYRHLLSDVAEAVRAHFPGAPPVERLKDGLNLEYTADNARLMREMEGFTSTTLEAGVARQVEWQRRQRNDQAGR